MFKRTSSLGTVSFKGQRALVIEAIARIPDPFTSDQVVEAIDKVAYEKTFTHGTQVVTIPQSVQYHLRELAKLGQHVQDASPIPVVRQGRGLDLGIGGRMGSENQGGHRAEEYSACILEMALKHYGYGRWDAPYWFIGPEPGQHGGNNVEERRADLKKRCEAWIHLERHDLVDCKKHHFGLGETRWHREVPPPATQATWRQLIRLLLAYRSVKEPDIEDIRTYQQRRWGMEHGETCVIELSSLAAPALNAPGPHGLFREERIEGIRKKIQQHRPKIVLMYGLSHTQPFQEIAGCALEPGIPVKISSTCFVHTPAPTARGFGRVYWLELAERLGNRGCS